MKSTLNGFLLLALLATMIGCRVPQKRLIWSPDGKRAVVMGADGLHVCDAEGNLSPLLVKGAERAVWLSDSKRLILARPVLTEDWSTLQPHLAQEQVAEIAEMARSLVWQMKVFMADPQHGDWQEEISRFLKERGHYDGPEGAIRHYISANLAAQWPDAMRDWLKVSDGGVLALTLATLTDQEIVIGRELAASLRPVQDIRIAAGDRSVSFTTGDSESESNQPVDVWVVAVELGGPRRIDTNVAIHPDWTPDGRTLVYVKSEESHGGDVELGVIQRRTVVDDRGTPLTDLPDAEPLAGVLMDPGLRIRCLRDGRIIFAAMEVTLPVGVNDLSPNRQFFALDPQRQSTVTRLVPRSQESGVGAWASLYELSPDQTRIVFPGDKGQVSILTLATGAIEVIQASSASNDWNGIVPVWRSAEQLCYTKGIEPSPGTRKANIVVRAADGQERVLSANWPDDVVKGFLDQAGESKPSHQ